VLLLWLGCRNGEIPSINRKRYKYHHEGYQSVPGKGLKFPVKASFASCTGVVLRSYAQPPIARTGNGFSDVTRPKAVLIFCPAFGSHMNWYAGLAQQIASVPIATVGIDYFGHGESGGARGYIENYENVVTDVLAYAESVQLQYPDAPLFLAGHAFGGNIAICAALRKPKLFAGLCLLSPDIRSDGRLYVRQALAALSGVLPRLRCFRVRSDKYSRNLSVADAVDEDPLWLHGRWPNQTVKEILRLSQYVNGALSQLTTPFDVQHGIQDLVCHPMGMRMLVTGTPRVLPAHKFHHPHQKAWHDLLHEAEHEDVAQFVQDFIDERTRLRFLATTLD